MPLQNLLSSIFAVVLSPGIFVSGTCWGGFEKGWSHPGFENEPAPQVDASNLVNRDAEVGAARLYLPMSVSDAWFEFSSEKLAVGLSRLGQQRPERTLRSEVADSWGAACWYNVEGR